MRYKLRKKLGFNLFFIVFQGRKIIQGFLTVSINLNKMSSTDWTYSS